MRLTVSIKHVLTIVTLLVSIAVISPTYTLAAYSTGNPVIDQLLNIAQAKLDAEYQVLIEGDTDKLKKAKTTLGGEAAGRVDEVATMQGNIFKTSIDHAIHYTDFTSELTVEKADISKDNAVITAKESATRTLMDNGSKDPIITKEVKNHQFYFTLINDQWILTKDEDLDKYIPAAPEPGIKKSEIKSLPDPFKGNKKLTFDQENH